MNSNLDSTLIVIVILLLVLIAGLIVVSIFLALNFYKKNKTTSSSEVTTKSEDPIIHSIGLCKNHDDRTSVGICAICEDEFCMECLKQIETVSLCPEHFSIYASNTWVSITNQRTTPNDPNEGIYIYKFKQHLWCNKNIPTFILNDYKIQVENDFIETYVQLHVPEDNKVNLQSELELFKRNHSNEK